MKITNRVEIPILNDVTTTEFHINTKSESFELLVTKNNRKELAVKVPKGKKMSLIIQVMD